MAEKDYLREYVTTADGTVNPHAVHTTADIGLRSNDKMPGGAVSISVNGGHDGIVWMSFAPIDALNTVGDGKGCLTGAVAIPAAPAVTPVQPITEVWQRDAGSTARAPAWTCSPSARTGRC